MSKQPLSDFASGEGEGQRSWVRKPEFPDEAVPMHPTLQELIDVRVETGFTFTRFYRKWESTRNGRGVWVTLPVPRTLPWVCVDCSVQGTVTVTNEDVWRVQHMVSEAHKRLNPECSSIAQYPQEKQ